jgi:RNA polymerase sigma factor (TIGR02999 family)
VDDLLNATASSPLTCKKAFLLGGCGTYHVHMPTEPSKPNASQPSDPFRSAETLLPVVYDELRRLAAVKMAGERRDHTLQATALVHEAWIRLGGDSQRQWPSRTYFFAAAAEAMRRILIEKARRKQSARKAGLENREDLRESQIIVNAPTDELISVHEALEALEQEDSQVAELVKLRYFVGLTMPQAAEAMDLPLRTTERLWSFGKVFLKSRIRDQDACT